MKGLEFLKKLWTRAESGQSGGLQIVKHEGVARRDFLRAMGVTTTTVFMTGGAAAALWKPERNLVLVDGADNAKNVLKRGGMLNTFPGEEEKFVIEALAGPELDIALQDADAAAAALKELDSAKAWFGNADEAFQTFEQALLKLAQERDARAHLAEMLQPGCGWQVASFELNGQQIGFGVALQNVPLMT